MLRLLQGDVGSGKTLVGDAGDAGRDRRQARRPRSSPRPKSSPASIIATLLEAARQPSACGSAILTGREKGKARESVLMGLADGSIDILVGTHAIFQEKVGYKKLGLAVIDEQHRFGVSQRLLLASKAETPAAPAGDDRDPDPAHADAHPIWRDGRQRDRRDAAGPNPGRNPRDQRRAAGRGHRRPRRGICRAGARPIGFARWSRKARRATLPRPRSGRACSGCVSARTGSGWSTGG